MARPAPIYISHSAKDADWCRDLAAARGRAGADVWYRRRAQASAASELAAERELRARLVFVFVVTPGAVASPEVQR